MANYYAAARSNYVHVDDRESLYASLSMFGGMELTEKEEGSDLYCILCEEGWPSWGTDENGDETEFNPEEHIMPFVREGEVFVMLESGHEKLRYIIGCADAYCRVADGEVLHWTVDINTIYAEAAREFGVPVASITRAEY